MNLYISTELVQYWKPGHAWEWGLRYQNGMPIADMSTDWMGSVILAGQGQKLGMTISNGNGCCNENRNIGRLVPYACLMVNLRQFASLSARHTMTWLARSTSRGFHKQLWRRWHHCHHSVLPLTPVQCVWRILLQGTHTLRDDYERMAWKRRPLHDFRAQTSDPR